ncbi:hypothetical protein BDV19DRAFT_391879 [Aspergillus venezuelensis]
MAVLQVAKPRMGWMQCLKTELRSWMFAKATHPESAKIEDAIKAPTYNPQKAFPAVGNGTTKRRRITIYRINFLTKSRNTPGLDCRAKVHNPRSDGVMALRVVVPVKDMGGDNITKLYDLADLGDLSSLNAAYAVARKKTSFFNLQSIEAQPHKLINAAQTPQTGTALLQRLHTLKKRLSVFVVSTVPPSLPSRGKARVQ